MKGRLSMCHETWIMTAGTGVGREQEVRNRGTDRQGQGNTHTHTQLITSLAWESRRVKNNSAAQGQENNGHPQKHPAERMERLWQAPRGHRLFFLLLLFFTFPGGEMSVQSSSSQDSQTLHGP